MGQRPRSDLFYGYVFNEGSTYPWEENENYDQFSEENAYKQEFDDDQQLLEALGINHSEMEYKEIWDKIKELDIKLVRWGWSDEPCYFICVNTPTAHISCDWDSPETIGKVLPAIPQEWDDCLKEFAKATGIDLKGKEPAWHLVSSYG